MDYKELLRKYVDHVCWEEGTTFISSALRSDEFTEEEKVELEKFSGPKVIMSEGPLTRSPEYSKVQKEWLLNELT